MMRIAGLLAVVLTLLFSPAFAVDSVPVNMSDLAAAAVVFTGTCTGVNPHIKEMPNGSKMAVTTLSFMVSDVIKGNGSVAKGSPFELTIPGVTREDAKTLRVMPLAIVPSYKNGGVYTLFLTAQSALIGMGQGMFSVVETADGKKQAVNEFNNTGLFVNIPPSRSMTKAFESAGISPAGPPASGPLDYDAFVRFVKEYKDPKKGE